MRPHRPIRSLLRAASLAAVFACGLAAQAADTATGAGASAPAAPDTPGEAAAALDAQQRQRDAGMPKCYLRGVEVRVPSEMRDSAPELLGLEEAGIDFRARTPALAEGELMPTVVDPVALREQRLAAFATPWASFGAASASAPVGPAAARPALVSAPAPGGGSSLGWLVLGALAVGAGGMVLRRAAQRRVAQG